MKNTLIRDDVKRGPQPYAERGGEVKKFQ